MFLQKPIPTMTPSRLRHIIEHSRSIRAGPLTTDRSLASFFHVHPITLRRWLNGDVPIPRATELVFEVHHAHPHLNSVAMTAAISEPMSPDRIQFIIANCRAHHPCAHMSTREIAAFLGVSQSTFRRWLSDKLPIPRAVQLLFEIHHAWPAVVNRVSVQHALDERDREAAD